MSWCYLYFFFFKQKTAYEMRISDWSSDVCSSDLWRLLIGPNVPEEEFRAIAATAAPGITVERARSDFVELLCRARLSISQGGYHTLMEVLATGVPGVVVPFARGRETEQTHRARALAAHIGIATCRERVWQFVLDSVV